MAIHATPLRVVFNGGWWGLLERYRGGCDDTAGRERTTGWLASWMVRRLVGWFAWVRGCVVAPPLSFLREFVSRKGALSRRATAPQETYTCHPVVQARNNPAGEVIRDRLFFSFFLSFRHPRGVQRTSARAADGFVLRGNRDLYVKVFRSVFFFFKLFVLKSVEISGWMSQGKFRTGEIVALFFLFFKG